MIKLETKKGYEEIQINGEIFKLDVSDETISFAMGETAIVLSEKLMNTKENKTIESLNEIVKEYINRIFLEEPYEKIYYSCGCSFINMVELLPEFINIYTNILKSKTGKMNKKHK